MDNIINSRKRLKIKFFQVLRDISNWFYIRKKIKKHRKTQAWKMHNLTYSWVYKLGAVVNIRAEDFGEPEEIHQIRVMSFVQPVLEYVSEVLELGEILIPKIERIEGANAYLIIFNQKFIALNLKYIITRLLWLGFLTGFFYFLMKYI